MSAVNPRIAPEATSRSTRRFTAGAESPTSEPISAKVARALCSRQPITCSSIASTTPPRNRSLFMLNGHNVSPLDTQENGVVLQRPSSLAFGCPARSAGAHPARSHW